MYQPWFLEKYVPWLLLVFYKAVRRLAKNQYPQGRCSSGLIQWKAVGRKTVQCELQVEFLPEAPNPAADREEVIEPILVGLSAKGTFLRVRTGVQNCPHEAFSARWGIENIWTTKWFG